jgi:hypothetical protein
MDKEIKEENKGIVIVLDATKDVYFKRPSLFIAEMETASGKQLDTAKQIWSAVEFETEMDPFDCGNFAEVHISLYYGRPSELGDEHWEFEKAKIAPISGYHNRFAMIYDRCVRIVKDEEPEPSDA